ncbi:MAG: glycosyltransferase [Flavobacteriaceae bacterium]|nr:glycosyltransferase [Flavobacteriaceae bacterium]
MKILVVSSKYDPEYSGSGFRAHKTYKRFEEKFGIEFDVITNSKIFTGNKKYYFNNVNIYRISAPIKNFNKNIILRYFSVVFNFIWQVYFSWNFIKKNHYKYDLVHTFGNTFTIGFISWYFSKKNKPIIRELCNEMINPLYPIQFQNTFKKIFLKPNTLIIAISKKLEIITSSYGIKNIWLRPNPIREDKFKIDYASKYFLRKKYTKFNESHVVISCIANFTENKNQIFLIDLLKKLPDNYRMVLNGPLKFENKGYYNLIKIKIKKLRLQNKIDLKSGFVSNFDEYIKLSDVFLVPSISEGMCTPILESQACGVPVVSNHIKDVTDKIIEKGKGGFTLPLNTKKWERGVIEALKIDQSILAENSKNVQNKSSSKIIDDRYYKKIIRLINL